jgi:hypothetical protein
MAVREEVFFEGPPHIGDLMVNTLVGSTIIGLPLFIGSLVRRIWVRYRITNRRITVMGGWGGQDRMDVIYGEISKVVTVPRGLGGWGDMVLTLKDGSRMELRSLPNFREVYDYVNERIQDQQGHRRSGLDQDVQAKKSSGVKVQKPEQKEEQKSNPETISEIIGSESSNFSPEASESGWAGFTPVAERLNGRVAMVGFILLVALEGLTGKTLIELINTFLG